MIKGLWNYALKAPDIDVAADFYVTAMNACVLKRGVVLGCNYIFLRIGKARVLIFDKAPYEDTLGISLPAGFLHAVYEVEDLEAHVTKLKESGVKFIIEPTIIETDWDVRNIAFFKAPDGMRMEVMEIIQTKEEL